MVKFDVTIYHTMAFFGKCGWYSTNQHTWRGQWKMLTKYNLD